MVKVIWYRSPFKREYRWRAVAANGRKIGHGGEGYKNKADMIAAFHLLRDADVEIVDQT